ncbi:MAG: YIP1 family protein [Bacteroidales bacterium]|nr:YIP1 family protein [Bacteroidales bacterium]
MDIINRVKNVLVTPKTEWQTIEAENTPYMKVFLTYVLILAAIPAIAAFIGYGLIGYKVWGIRIVSMNLGIRQAIIQYVTMTGGVFVTAFVVDMLAKSFGAVKDINRAFSLVAYAYTPMFVAGIFYILPKLSWIGSLAGIYGLYLLYIGLQPMMKAPAEKQTTYFIVSLIVMAVVWVILSMVLAAILMPKLGGFGF